MSHRFANLKPFTVHEPGQLHRFWVCDGYRP